MQRQHPPLPFGPSLAFIPAPFSQALCRRTSALTPDKHAASFCNRRATCSLLTPEEQFALSVARLAADVCARVSLDDGAATVRQKRDRTPVTVADVAIQAIATQCLADTFPGDLLVGEEDGAYGDDDDTLWSEVNAVCESSLRVPRYDARRVLRENERAPPRTKRENESGRGRVWCIDPIDGTKGFISNADYAVGLALLHTCAPVTSSPSSYSTSTPYPPVAALALPRERLVLVSNTHKRICYSLPSAVDAHFISDSVTSVTKTAQCELDTQTTWYLSGGGAQLYIEGLSDWTPLCCGSLVKYAGVARGRATFFVQLLGRGRTAHLWDHAAGISVVDASGGTVTDEHGVNLVIDSDAATVAVAEHSQAIVATTPGAAHADICRRVRLSLSKPHERSL